MLMRIVTRIYGLRISCGGHRTSSARPAGRLGTVRLVPGYKHSRCQTGRNFRDFIALIGKSGTKWTVPAHRRIQQITPRRKMSKIPLCRDTQLCVSTDIFIALYTRKDTVKGKRRQIFAVYFRIMKTCYPITTQLWRGFAIRLNTSPYTSLRCPIFRMMTFSPSIRYITLQSPTLILR